MEEKINVGIYEKTVTINSSLSRWNVNPILVLKLGQV